MVLLKCALNDCSNYATHVMIVNNDAMLASSGRNYTYKFIAVTCVAAWIALT